jgi:hypothetical protein
MRLMIVLRHAVCVALVLAGSQQVWAQSTQPSGQTTGAITTAVPFLLINPDSRSAGLGDAGVAIANNANAMFWNPAALAFLPNKGGFALNYTPWLRYIIPDINHYFIPGYYNLGEKGGVIGASLTYFSLGEIEFRNDQGISQGTYRANEFAFSVAYARKITQYLSGGASLRYVRSDLAGAQNIGGISLQPGESVAGDISFYYSKPFVWGKTPMTWNWGINISNIGSKMSYSGDVNVREFLPTNLRLGTAFKADIDEYNAITWTIDFNKLMVPSDPADRRDKSLLSGMFSSLGDRPFSEELAEITISTGVEYWYNKVFAGRIGFFHEDPTKGGRQYVSLGVGTRFRDKFTFDFAFIQPLRANNPLQNTLRFTLGFDMPQVKSTAATRRRRG